MATSLKARAMLSLAYGCGLRASEVARLQVCGIDSEQMIIRVVQSKGRKDRNVMLPPPRSSACCGKGGRRGRNGVTPASRRNDAGCFPIARPQTLGEQPPSSTQTRAALSLVWCAGNAEKAYCSRLARALRPETLPTGRLRPDRDEPRLGRDAVGDHLQRAVAPLDRLRRVETG